ncbi:MAG: copper transporter [Romboutsia sp.]
MHINMKYYIVTIGAIFIALGIGILVGFTLNYDQELSKQQASVINDLDKKFETLKTTNDDLNSKLGLLQSDYKNTIDFINYNSEKLIADSLVGKNIGIVSIDEESHTSQIKDIVSKADGVVSFEITIKSNIEKEEKLKEISERLNIEIKTSTEAINYIVDLLQSEGADSKLKELQSLGVIKVNLLDSNYISYKDVIIAGGDLNKELDESYTNLYTNLIAKLKDNDKYIVGSQQSNSRYSYVDLFKTNKIASIDNIDEGVGQVSLIIALQDDNLNGSYGKLETAESLIPYKKK